MSDYVSAINKVWSPAFGERNLKTIKPSEIKKIIAERAKVVSGKTINNNMIPLRGIFELAVDDELLERSPLDRIKSQKHQKREPDPFDREETEQILAYMRDHYDEQVWNWYEFAFGTGMRPSEQIVVQWRDVDWKRQTIRIERARVRAVEKSTKTRTVRDIDLTPRMMAVLQRQKAHSFMRGLDSPIFINPVTNTPWPDVQDQRKLYFHPTRTRARHPQPGCLSDTPYLCDDRADGRREPGLYLPGNSVTEARRCCSGITRNGSTMATLVVRPPSSTRSTATRDRPKRHFKAALPVLVRPRDRGTCTMPSLDSPT